MAFQLAVEKPEGSGRTDYPKSRPGPTFKFFKASRLTSGSHMIDLNHPTPQHGNLINPSIGERYLEIPPKKRFKNHESNTGSLRIAKFDLNELPEDTGSEMSHKHHDEISELGSEKDSPAHGTISLADSKSSSADIGYVSSEPASDQDQRINDSDFVRDLSDFYTIRRSMNKPRRRYDQKDKKQHSLKRLKGTNSLHSKKSSTKSVAKNRKRKKSDDSEEQDLSREVKGKNKIFKTSLTTKVKNPGPFDLQGEKAYRSPYNRVLLGYIKKNLKNILPAVSDKFMEFNSKLLESESGSINIRSGIRAKILNQTWSRMIATLTPATRKTTKESDRFLLSATREG
ncbi:hypothetical protein BY996DRAFT_6472861 [Phakopsora pachyrhizi]|nr:hypothetical protein BY996DRAFT_6472861 [Phakopsora pachyrhizi]